MSSASARIQDLPADAALSDARASALVFSAAQADPAAPASRIAIARARPSTRAQDMPLDVAVDEACAMERVFATLQAEPTAAASRDASASV
jgi:hypothetical protein